jgi:hypothetical protein
MASTRSQSSPLTSVFARPRCHSTSRSFVGAVRTRRDGNRIFYAAENEHIERLASEALLQADHLVTGGRHHAKRDTA